MDLGSSSVVGFPYDKYTTDDWSAQLTQKGHGPDTDNIAGTVTVNKPNGRRRYVLVYNNSGGTLPAGCALMFSATFHGSKVVKCTSGSRICGFVPPVIDGSVSNTIAAASYFWMVVEGYTSVLKSTANVTETDQIEPAATAGQIKSNSGTGYSGILAGTILATDTGGTATLVRAYVNCQW